MDIYAEIVLEHSKHPKNFGPLKNPTHVLKASNASCGDMIEFQLVVDDKGIITEVGWRGISCAISTASASVMSELIKGKSVTEAMKLKNSDLLEQLGLTEILPTREKCLHLPLKALDDLQKG